MTAIGVLQDSGDIPRYPAASQIGTPRCISHAIRLRDFSNCPNMLRLERFLLADQQFFVPGSSGSVDRTYRHRKSSATRPPRRSTARAANRLNESLSPRNHRRLSSGRRLGCRGPRRGKIEFPGVALDCFQFLTSVSSTRIKRSHSFERSHWSECFDGFARYVFLIGLVREITSVQSNGRGLIERYS
jgi:hypothetical protein